MRDFRIKLINEPPPKTVNLLINSIILPKGIKRGKSSQGSEPFDGEEMDQRNGSIFICFIFPTPLFHPLHPNIPIPY